MLNQNDLYVLQPGKRMRWATAENIDGAISAGGQVNHGRKGKPSLPLPAGETLTIAAASGSGTIRRIWITFPERTPQIMRGLVLRAYWDGAETPAVEAPIGDFFGVSLGCNATFENAWFGNAEGRSYTCRVPMPFRTGCRLTVSNETASDISMLFYEVDYTIGDEHPDNTGYFHAVFNREYKTRLKEDFHILPHVKGKGCFLGCTIGVIADIAKYGKTWWGEGEVKVYLDGDTDYPTLCGTGTEDYIATGWGQGQYAQLWHGCPVADHEKLAYSFYRLHGPDPIYFDDEIRVTIQQIGCCSREDVRTVLTGGVTDKLMELGDGTKFIDIENIDAMADYVLFEREDDWSATAYFYLDKPENGLPAIAGYDERVAEL